MSHFKSQMSTSQFSQKEIPINCFAGLISGVISAIFTNSLETITVAKQTNPSIDLRQMIKTERTKLLTRGLFASVYYNGA